ncbi:hypothetical protein LEL_08400 [Akanthomyces lecanii RCEF 1005]|uniref:Uncharacterized protein n=1 Tax=Akanthomyces lecanii RCEF 1005 TaxID=1081108 RepID=A0A168DHD0_CORDF|nr:hypothetical protein LEL_08400 [Akanthomyces lecanii RCEF 1005]
MSPQPQYKREDTYLSEDSPLLVVDDGNSTRRATDEEINDNWEILVQLYGLASEGPDANPVPTPVFATSEPTTMPAEATTEHARFTASPAGTRNGVTIPRSTEAVTGR